MYKKPFHVLFERNWLISLKSSSSLKPICLSPMQVRKDVNTVVVGLNAKGDSSLDSNERFDELKEAVLQKLLRLNPYLATMIGLHEPYDKLWGDGSSKRFYDELSLFEDTDKKMEALDFDALTDDNKIDWKVIKHALAMEEFVVHEQRIFEKNPDPFYEEIGGTIFIMIAREYAPLEKRMEALAERLEKLPEFLRQFRTRFEKSKPVKLWTEIAIEACQQMPFLFQFIVNSTKGRIPNGLHDRLAKAVADLNVPINQQMDWLKSLLQKAEEQWALGQERFDKLLKIRNLGMTADEIVSLGEKYLREMKDTRERLVKQIAPDKTLKEVIESIENEAPKNFEEALKLTAEQVEAAKRYVIEHDIATVYVEDTLSVKETPGFMVPLIPFAAMITPAKFDKKQEGIYVVTRPHDPKNLGKHLNLSAIPGTAVHEAYPGHFLQSACSNRGSIVRWLGQGTEVIEGWAHYCEQMMTEKGFIKDPKTRLMQINDVIWRAVRIIVDVKLSQGKMSFDGAVDMLVKEAEMSREAAIAEVRRYTQTPGYALSYLTGKHLICQLREEIKRKMGKEFKDKFFHDTITHYGIIPFYLLREVFEQKLCAKSTE
jgi:uncharacterized protein (DUF885 family)